MVNCSFNGNISINQSDLELKKLYDILSETKAQIGQRI